MVEAPADDRELPDLSFAFYDHMIVFDNVQKTAIVVVLAKVEKDSRVQGTAPVSAIAPPPRETFLTQLADAAVEATKKLAFPLGLALMVGAFLMVQGRIDRKDAKLALAPIDSEQDLLSFQ